MNTITAFAFGFAFAVGIMWVFSMCRAAGRADMCSECIRRRGEEKLEEQAMRAASIIIMGRSQTDEIGANEFGITSGPSQVITPLDCGVLQGGSESSQQAGTSSIHVCSNCGKRLYTLADFDRCPSCNSCSHYDIISEGRFKGAILDKTK